MPDKNQDYEEEYHLPEEEYITPEIDEHDLNDVSDNMESAEVKPSTSIASKVFSFLPQTRNMRILLVIGLIIVIAAIVHFLHRDQALIVPVPARQAPQPVAAAPPKPTPLPQIQPQQPDDLSGLNALRTSNLEMAEKMNQMQSQMANMQTALTQSQTTNAQLQQTVTMLTTQLNQLSTKFNNLMTGLDSGQPPYGPRVAYHIRAILPDRAWLKSNVGEILTVTIGDQIKGYGIVRSIDPRQGIIETSSGRKIYYGTNDF